MNRPLCVTLMGVVIAGMAPFAQHQDAGLLTELLALSDSDEFLAPAPATVPRTDTLLVAWRLYDPQDSLEFRFNATNESREPIVVDQPRLRQSIKLTMSEGDVEVPVRIEWLDQVLEWGNESPTPVASAQQIFIQAQEATEWRFVVHRTDGKPFEFGTYVVSVELSPKSAIRTPDGREWSGRHSADGKAYRLISIQPPKSAEERLNRHALVAERAHRLHDLNGELTAWLRAASENPGNSALDYRVGVMYMIMGRYPEAARTWEGIAARPGRKPSDLEDSLATAYLGIGDEARARQILKQAGKDEAAVTVRVSELRKRLRPRVP